MPSKRCISQRKGSPDDFQSPPEVILPLLPFIPKDKIIWEPAAGNGNITSALRDQGYTVFPTDILTGQDFLSYTLDEWDMIITNPPYSIKTQWLKRCYELGKPFALLVPYTMLETEKRQALYRQYGVQLIFVNKRYNFETPNKIQNSGAWFPTLWLCHGIDLPNQITFVDVAL